MKIFTALLAFSVTYAATAKSNNESNKNTHQIMSLECVSVNEKDTSSYVAFSDQSKLTKIVLAPYKVPVFASYDLKHIASQVAKSEEQNPRITFIRALHLDPNAYSLEFEESLNFGQNSGVAELKVLQGQNPNNIFWYPKVEYSLAKLKCQIEIQKID